MPPRRGEGMNGSRTSLPPQRSNHRGDGLPHNPETHNRHRGPRAGSIHRAHRTAITGLATGETPLTSQAPSGMKSFFAVIDKGPVEVVAADVFEFVADQRGDRAVVRISDGESGVSARTIARRLSSISGLYAYLVARGDTAVTTNPARGGLSPRRWGGRRRQVPLVRVPRTLPKILSP